MFLKRWFRLGLFEAVGVELEYMIVDRETLDVRPIADALLKAAAGSLESEVEQGAMAWSNELALHVIELKTNGPARHLSGLAGGFLENVGRVNALLEPLGARLMPGAMHPWMDPEAELALWPHEYAAVYEAFDQVFGCRGHGWANIQSTHLNLPFADDEEFGRLHAAIRLVLPILPALAASSPVAGGELTGSLDTRLACYRAQARKVPSVSGLVIPEAIFTRDEYTQRVLGPIYDDLAPRDPAGTLRHEWVNARGAIPRFERGSLEIRLLDVQECPAADLAIAAAVIRVVRALALGELAGERAQRRWQPGPLAAILGDTTQAAERALVRDRAYLDLFGFPGSGLATARELWWHLIERTLAREPGYEEWAGALRTILDEGCLARRIAARLQGDVRRERLREVYEELCRCLAAGQMFRGAG